MNILFKKVIFIFTFLFISFKSYADDPWKYQCQVNAGCNLTIYASKTQKFPGVKFFGGISINSIHNHDLLINYSASLGCYVKSLGNNLNPQNNDNQLDFTHTFIGGYYWGKDLNYTKYLRTLNNVPFNNVFIKRDGLAYIGTILVFNNHHRNQAIGCMGFNTKKLSLNYSNDGPPFNSIGFGDAFDRWWTGHGGIYFHTSKNYNTAEIGFDQFTGYSPLLYELSQLLGVEIPDYNISYRRDSTNAVKNINHKYEYNSSTYTVKINFDQNFGMDIGCIGSLKTNHDRYFGVQELIHNMASMSLHPNQDQNRFLIGPNYRYTSYVK